MDEYTVTIINLTGNREHQTIELAGRYETRQHAIGAAVAQAFGRGAWFNQDTGIPPATDRDGVTSYYGQVFRRLRGTGGQNTSITDRIRIDVAPRPGAPSCTPTAAPTAPE